MDPSFGTLIEQRLRATHDAISAIGGRSDPVNTAQAATLHDVETAEERLGFQLPDAFRDVVLKFSAEVLFGWFLPEDFELPGPFNEIFSGDCRWSLPAIVELNEAKDGWIKAVFPDPGDPYDKIWHGKLAFLDVSNGDYLAIDLSPQHHGQVVYLSHDDGEGHGRRLAPDFEQFMLRWTGLGCVGAEDWQWLPFADGPDGFLNPEGDNARAFRELLNLKL